ncbi:MAG TPA: tail fiber protein [Allosphingosinicella sp.]|jgi:microcystin-dependent protein
MAQPYIGEIRMFAGVFYPNGWLFCEGQLLPIAENEALFQLIGTTYGGDGESNFALPNLTGRVPVHMNGSYIIGSLGGAESVTLTSQQIPTHTHALIASTDTAGQIAPGNQVLGSGSSVKTFRPDVAATVAFAPSITPVGGSEPHTNMQPYLAVNYIISLFGLFPSPN